MDIKSRQVLHLEQEQLRTLIVEALRARGFEMTGAVNVTFVAHQHDGKVGVLVENMTAPAAAEEPAPKRRGGRKARPKISNERIREVVHQVLFREGDEGPEQLIAEFAVEILSDHGEIPRDADLRQEQQKLVPRVRKALEELAGLGQAKFVDDDDEGRYWTAVRPKKAKAPAAGDTVAEAVSQRHTIDVVSGEDLPKNSRCIWIADVGMTTVPVDEWPEEMLARLTPEQLSALEQLPMMKASAEPESEADVAADILGGEGGVMGRGDALESGLKE